MFSVALQLCFYVARMFRLRLFKLEQAAQQFVHTFLKQDLQEHLTWTTAISNALLRFDLLCCLSQWLVSLYCRSAKLIYYRIFSSIFAPTSGWSPCAVRPLGACRPAPIRCYLHDLVTSPLKIIL